MKKFLFILLVSLFSNIHSQMSWINGITISPSTPTELDSITVFVDLSFAYSDCPLDHKFISVLGNEIQSSSHHCQGPLAAICDTRDTLTLAPLPVGTYKLIHSSTSGSGSVPCTPGFVVDDIDSIEFYVVNSALSSVTFKVNMNNVTDNFTNPEINGTFNSFCGNCDTMVDPNQDNIWEFTSYFPVGDTMEYKFSADNWSIEENLDGNLSCTNGDLNNTNRIFIVPSQDTILDAVCWGSCDTCPSLPSFDHFGFYDSEITVYPNPVIKEARVDVKNIEDPFTVQLFDMHNRLISNSTSSVLHMADLRNGIYIVSVQYKELKKRVLVIKN